MTERARRLKDTLYRSSQQKSIRIVRRSETGKGQSVTFILAVGSTTQVCFEYNIQNVESGLQLSAKAPDCVRSGGSDPFRTWRDGMIRLKMF